MWHRESQHLVMLVSACVLSHAVFLLLEEMVSKPVQFICILFSIPFPFEKGCQNVVWSRRIMVAKGWKTPRILSAGVAKDSTMPWM